MNKFFLGSIIFLSLIYCSCTQKNQRIIGKWSVTECSITNLDDLRKSQLGGIPDSLLDQYKERLEGQIKAFIEDGKKEIYVFEKDSFDITRRGKSDKGIWKISSDSKMLFLLPNESPAAEAINIDGISAKEIKLSKKITAESNAVYLLKKQ